MIYRQSGSPRRRASRDEGGGGNRKHRPRPGNRFNLTMPSSSRQDLQTVAGIQRDGVGVIRAGHHRAEESIPSAVRWDNQDLLESASWSGLTGNDHAPARPVSRRLFWPEWRICRLSTPPAV